MTPFALSTPGSPDGAASRGRSLEALRDRGWYLLARASFIAAAVAVIPLAWGQSCELPHETDLRCEGQATRCTWQAEPGDVSYDLVRGNVGELGAVAAGVSLGNVVCIENDSLDLSNEGAEDTVDPLPGEAFFYVMRAATSVAAGTYGGSWTCSLRRAQGGDCGGPGTATFVVGATIEGDGRWYDYFSDAFAEVDGGPFYGPLGGVNDGFYLISALPSYVNIGGGANVFPFDEDFSGVGSVSYDLADVTGVGTEVAVLTDVFFDFDDYCADDDAITASGYETSISAFTGTVELRDGLVTAVNVDADIVFTYDFTSLGGGITPYRGTLEITGDFLDLFVDESYPSGFPDPFRFIWDLQGELQNLATP